MSVRLVKIIDPTAIVVGGLVPKGAYSGGTAYSVGDSVSYNGSSYVCITASTGNLPTDTAYWQLVASKGDTGPTGPAGTTDYNELDNLPTLGTAAAKDIPATGNASATEVVYGTDTRLTDSRPASDVSAWAKAPTKPTYTKSEVGLSNVNDTSDANKPISTATQTALDTKATTTALDAHTDNTSNPHSVTKAQVGLSDVDNTSDANKPVSTATQTALNAKANASDTVNLTGDQTIAGVKTFTSAPIAPSGTSIGGVLHLTGTGFPEGVVTASTGSIYIDTAITNGASSWIKKSGTGNTGWWILEGDTGWRRNDPANSWFLNGATPGADGDSGTCFRREGNVVHCILGLTTPAGWTNGTDFLAVPNGFRTPNNAKYMPGGYYTASTMAVYSVGTSMRFYSGVVSSVRFQWTWITNDPWPTTLPGIAA